MLTDDEKEHIREEEVYRREVRNGLETTDRKGSKWHKYWSIVNSAVFIWFLSSVVLGSASLLYTRWEQERARERERAAKDYLVERENKKTALRLDAEITNRLVYFSNLLKIREVAFAEQSGMLQYGEIVSMEEYSLAKVLVALERPSAMEYPVNVFPEYANRNFRSLLWELMGVVPDEEKGSLQPAYERAAQLQQIYLKTRYAERRSPKQRIIHAFQARALSESAITTGEVLLTFNLPRWGSVFMKRLDQRADTSVGVQMRGK
jgi:hypothetical protein